MPDSRGSQVPLDPAEAAFLEFLTEQDSDIPVGFEAFAARHPSIAAELHKLHEAWLDVARLFRRARDADVPGPEKLEELRIEEAAAGEGLKLELAGELVRRLAGARPASERYEARGELARGGMGVIYRIWDPHLRRELAMKVILARREVSTPDERGRAMYRALARFLEEAQVTSQLDHPGVVPVHDLGIDATGRVYFTMRLVRGRNFRAILELIRRGKEGWSLTRALGVILKVCEAVAYAHSKGVIHRDLKPANVMVGRFGEVYVMDWGLARVLGRKDAHDLRIAADSTRSGVDLDARRWGQTPGSPLLTMDGRVVGTPSYMAPEQAKGRVDELGPRSDVYAIGAMLYHLLTHRMPYVPEGAEASPIDVYFLLLAGAPAPVKQLAPDVPDELAAICEKAMARDPADRYADALELAQDVEAFLGRRPVRALAPTIGYVARLYFERNKALTATVAAALLVLAGVVAFASWKNFQKQRLNERLLDLRSAQALASTFAELLPATPDRLPALDDWLSSVAGVLAKAPSYRQELASARQSADQAVQRELEPAVAAMNDLERLRPSIEAWRNRAAELRRVSLEECDREWREVIDDVARDERYRGLVLAKQLGLVPLGKNRGNLWEFWHVLSGERPRKDPAAPDRWLLAESSGMVLVLVPGGRALVGSPLQDEWREPTESEPHEVDSPPFFIGAFEVTQAQWLRVMGSDPSRFTAGTLLAEPESTAEAPARTTGLNPVESVSWTQAVEYLRRVALELPDEVSWEIACRAGTATRFCWGDEGASLEGNENVADLSASESLTWPEEFLASWNDGFKYHAPVASFRPNPFGLFDMHGNVAEWCSNVFVDEPEVRGAPNASHFRAFRGGSWYAALFADRSAFRQWDLDSGSNHARGLRAYRRVE